jgi:hypothetical protein
MKRSETRPVMKMVEISGRGDRARETGIQETDIRVKNSCFCYRAVGPRVSHISQTFGVFTVETKILHFSKLHFFYNFYYNLLTQ